MSLTEPGWAKYDIEKKDLTYGIIDVGKTKGFERIDLIRKEVINRLHDPYGYNANLVLLEGYSFASRGNSAISLGELGGVIRHYLYQEHTDYFEVPPTVLKKFLTNLGTASKAIMLKELFKRFEIDVNNDNEADAITLVHFGRALIEDEDLKLLSFQKEIVNKFKNPHFQKVIDIVFTKKDK
jgi:Holliday junction resolvasome RuvABC endonuclease subunit